MNKYRIRKSDIGTWDTYDPCGEMTARYASQAQAMRSLSFDIQNDRWSRTVFGHSWDPAFAVKRNTTEKVTSQTELDAALADPSVLLIDIHSSGEDWLELRSSDGVTVRVYGEAKVRVSGSARVMAFDRARVTASGSARVSAYDSTTVVAYGRSTVVANDSAVITAYDTATIMANGSVIVSARGSVRVMAYDTATIIAYGSTTVSASGCVAVHLHSPDATVTDLVPLGDKAPSCQVLYEVDINGDRVES